MLATNKIKWLGTLTIAGVLLVLALIGGDWGTTYAADASVNAAPEIYYIDPSRVEAGSPYIVMIIIGANFGTDPDSVRVRLTGTGVDKLLPPISVLPDGISTVIDASYLVEPKEYKIRVIRSNPGSIPTIPITPWDEESNEVPFYVLVLTDSYLPIISK